MLRIRTRIALVTVVAATLAAAGCGGGGKTVTHTVDETVTQTTPTSSSSTTATSTSTSGHTFHAPEAGLPTAWPPGPRSIHITSNAAVASGLSFGSTNPMDVAVLPGGGLAAAWYDSTRHEIMFAEQLDATTWDTPQSAGEPHGGTPPTSVSVAADSHGPAVVWTNPSGGGVSFARRAAGGGRWEDSYVLQGTYDQANATAAGNGIVVVATSTENVRSLDAVLVNGTDPGSVHQLDTGARQGRDNPIAITPTSAVPGGGVAVTWNGPGAALTYTQVNVPAFQPSGFNGTLGVYRTSARLSTGPDGTVHALFGGSGSSWWEQIKGSQTRKSVLQQHLQCDPGGNLVTVGFQPAPGSGTAAGSSGAATTMPSAPRLLYGYGCDVGWSVYNATNHQLRLPHETDLVGSFYPEAATTDGTNTVLLGIGGSNSIRAVTLD
jgi:hypothetical protein